MTTPPATFVVRRFSFFSQSFMLFCISPFCHFHCHQLDHCDHRDNPEERPLGRPAVCGNDWEEFAGSCYKVSWKDDDGDDDDGDDDEDNDLVTNTRSPNPHHLRGGQDLELAPFCKICNFEKEFAKFAKFAIIPLFTALPLRRQDGLGSSQGPVYREQWRLGGREQ